MRILYIFFFLLFTGVIFFGPYVSAADLTQSETSKAFLSLAERFGLWAALCVLLIIIILVTSWYRETRMAKRIDVLEKDLVTLSNETTKTMTTCSALLNDIKKVSEKSDATLSRIEIIFSQKSCPFERRHS